LGGCSSLFAAGARTQKEAIDYCKKDGQFEEKGSPKTPGRKWIELDPHTQIHNGVKIRQLSKEYVLSDSQLRAAEKWQAFKLEKWREKPEVIWIYGPTGTGKAEFTRKWRNDEDTYFWDGWWQEYEGESTVIVDEFRGSIPFYQLLKLLDDIPYPVYYKGGEKYLQSKRFIFTSHIHPKDLCDTIEDKTQLLRRITKKYIIQIIHLDSKWIGIEFLVILYKNSITDDHTQKDTKWS
jgi:hypothetical protein